MTFSLSGEYKELPRPQTDYFEYVIKVICACNTLISIYDLTHHICVIYNRSSCFTAFAQPRPVFPY